MSEPWNLPPSPLSAWDEWDRQKAEEWDRHQAAHPEREAKRGWGKLKRPTVEKRKRMK